MEQLTDHAQDHDRPTRIDCRYIPVRPSGLAAAIDNDPDVFGRVAGTADLIFRAIDHVIEQEVSALHEYFDELYAALNPDEDTPRELIGVSAQDRGEEDLLAHLHYLLDKANFRALGEPDIEVALQAGTTYGVRVRIDPSRVEYLKLYVRGRDTETIDKRPRFAPWRKVPTEAQIYRRLVVATRLRDEPGLRLKLFRDIPVRDIEALMPHAEVHMSLFDRLKVFGAGAGALGGLATKAFTAITTGVFSLFSLASAALIGFGGLAFKAFFGYKRTKHKRTSARTQHLYERNLANNASVIHALLRMIRQEEVKEASLAYAFLVSCDKAPGSEFELDRQIEEWIEKTFLIALDFDCPDAIETLDRLNLWKDRSSMEALSPKEALETLAMHWKGRFTESYHIRTMSRQQEHDGKNAKILDPAVSG